MTGRANAWLAVFVAATACLLVSCAAPLYDRAEIPTGISGGIGVGLGSAWATSGSTHDGFATLDAVFNYRGTAFVNCGLTPDMSLSLQASYGPNYWFRSDLRDSLSPSRLEERLDCQLAFKLRAGRKGAFRLSAGAPSGFDVAYLHDYSQWLTGSLGLGTRGLTLGVVSHVPLGRHAVLHASLGAASGLVPIYPSAFCGMGCEFR